MEGDNLRQDGGVSISPEVGPRCSAWARTTGVDPIGTAGCYRGFVLVQQPLPWPRDVSEIERHSGLSTLARNLGVLLQAVLPVGGEPLLTLYLAPESEMGFSGFVRREGPIGTDPAATFEYLLSDGNWRAPTPDAAPIRDILICTHGRRDVCCGGLGTSLALGLAHTQFPSGTRQWRTSHTGGHRFAPTFIVLPEGTLWSYADAKLVEQVVWRQGDPATVADRYRGCSGLVSPAIQALEHEVLRRVGWDLLDRHRLGLETTGATKHLRVRRPEGATDVWEADVFRGRELAVPGCSRPIGESTKSEHEWLVKGLRLLPGSGA